MTTPVEVGSGFGELDDLIAFLSALADVRSDEDNGMMALDHGLQCAFELARARPSDSELQVAGLVHDIGHEFAPDESHGEVGAAQVRKLLGERVAALLRAHVPAKRYLITTAETYRSVLSETSLRTLELQGGSLSERELADFVASPYFVDAVVLRRADDAAKVLGRPVPTLEHWLPALRDVAR